MLEDLLLEVLFGGFVQKKKKKQKKKQLKKKIPKMLKNNSVFIDISFMLLFFFSLKLN